MPRALLPLLLLGLMACAHRPPPQQGKASWYGPGFAGKPTASGVPFRPHRRTAAHKTLPFGTLLLVTNLRNKRSIIVRVTDRGPYIPGRMLDLSSAAADALRMKSSGVATVRVDIMRP